MFMILQMGALCCEKMYGHADLLWEPRARRENRNDLSKETPCSQRQNKRRPFERSSLSAKVGEDPNVST